MLRFGSKLFGLLLAVNLLNPPVLAGESSFLDESAVTWKVNKFDVARWKTLVGGNEGDQLDQADVQFGRWQLAPGATYHAHRHDAPEIYYIVSGEAEWTVDSYRTRPDPQDGQYDR